MFEHQKIHKMDDFFLKLDSRPVRGVYFYRVNGYTDEIGQFIKKYYEKARLSGVVIEGKIPNPDKNNLAYYEEVMGMDFQMNVEFISESLRKWLPRMKEYQRNNVALSLYNSLDSLRKAGKNANMLKNAYIKFMCWLYYKFERIVNLLGEDEVPKILYEGEINNYELMLISILSNAGCDVLLLQYKGDQNYKALDASSKQSNELIVSNMTAFPGGYSLKQVREQIQTTAKQERLYGKKPELLNCTNAWIEGKGLDDILQNIVSRGTDPKLFYNCFCRINGVEDKLTYTNELYQFGQELKSTKRKVVIADGEISQPTMEEIAAVNRKTYQNQDQMLMDLSSKLQHPANIELQCLMVKAFLDVLLEESKHADTNFNRLTNKGVYLVCWIKRYQSQLFANWNAPDISCFIHMGGCKNENEALFLKMLARLPVDVLILSPNLNEKCCLTDPLLYEINYEESVSAAKFPRENSDVKIGTVAYQAERELDTIMYQDSGIYRNRQYSKANIINLQTMYEEIKILWNQELKYRPSFSTIEDTVNIPVIFAKISGIKNGKTMSYWQSVKEFIGEDTFLIKDVPFIQPAAPNPMKAFAAEFYKNRKLQRKKIREHAHYPYAVLRDEMQEHMLDKLQQLIDEKLIRGTFENGTEYAVIAAVMNLPKDLVRMIQKFDFTKKNPKVVYINTSEKMVSLDDAVLIAFLNLIGFDVICFVPTGYQTIERYYNKKLMEEHQIGEYIYDLTVPDFAEIPLNTRPKSWRDIIFKRGT